EAFELMQSRLNPDGILLINFVGSFDKDSAQVVYSVNSTLKEVFKYVDLYLPHGYGAGSTHPTNFTFVAYSNKEKINKNLSINPPINPRVAAEVWGLLDRKFAITEEGEILTDDYNPIDFQDIKLREEFRSGTILSADKEIVIF
ncbi:MAG: hypothetical protein V3T30_06925, partial [Thermodesulfobacteriota bacterium]